MFGKYIMCSAIIRFNYIYSRNVLNITADTPRRSEMKPLEMAAKESNITPLSE